MVSASGPRGKLRELFCRFAGEAHLPGGRRAEGRMSQAEGVAKFIRGAAHAGACDGAPDAELVRRFAATGDEQAFRALVARYGPVVWAVCRRVAGNYHDAEDAF